MQDAGESGFGNGRAIACLGITCQRREGRCSAGGGDSLSVPNGTNGSTNGMSVPNGSPEWHDVRS